MNDAPEEGLEVDQVSVAPLWSPTSSGSGPALCDQYGAGTVCICLSCIYKALCSLQGITVLF